MFRRHIHHFVNTLKRVGNTVNRGFNHVKSFVRRHSSKVIQTAGIIKEAMAMFSDLPYVGEAAKTVGTIARGLHSGTTWINKGLDKLEEHQTLVGLPISNER